MPEDQIIKIKGKDGGWYKEAIFIVGKEMVASCTHKDLEQRADMIIGNYAKKNGLGPKSHNPLKHQSHQSKDQALNLILFSSIAILMICLWLLRQNVI